MPAPTPPKSPAKSKIIVLSTKDLLWKNMEDAKRALHGYPVIIRGTEINLNGCQLWGGKLPHPKDRQDESSLPLRTLIKGLWLRNGQVRDIPGGIVGRRDYCTFSKLDFLDIGEDGLSNVKDDSKGWDVISCRFFGASDKSLQCNDGRELLIHDCTFVGGITAIRIQESSAKAKAMKAESLGNTFWNCRTAHNLARVAVTARVNNYMTKMERWVHSHGSTVKELT